MKKIPRASEIEKSVLAAMLLHSENRDEIFTALDDIDFYHTSHRLIFAKIKELHQSGSPVGIDTLYEGLSGDESDSPASASYVSKLLDSEPPSVDLAYHVSILKDRRAKRRTIELVNSIEKRCYSGNGDLSEVLNDTQLISEEIRDAKGLQSTSFKFIHNEDIITNLQSINWQIRDILVEDSFYYDFGDPGSFKTFIALDRLLCIAAGIDYHGHRVKQGTVFYIAGEGQQGIGRRIAAWHNGHKTNAADTPFFLAKTPTQLMDPIAVDEVRRAVDALAKEYGPPAVLHIDTLARNFGEGDENATKDMNRVIQNLDVAFGNDFCRGITHHTGHANKDRARGSIALHGAADEAFRVSLSASGQVLVECRKMKDAPTPSAMLFDLNSILLLIGNEKDNSFTLSLAAEGEEAASAAKKEASNTNKISGAMKKALSLLDKMYAEYEKNLSLDDRNSIPRVTISDWRDACMGRKYYRKKPNFNRALESMLERNLVYFDDNNTFVYSVSIYSKYLNKGDYSDE